MSAKFPVLLLCIHINIVIIITIIMLTNIKNHSCKNDETKPFIKCTDKKQNSYNNINNSW